jgi:hypothetical protein
MKSTGEAVCLHIKSSGQWLSGSNTVSARYNEALKNVHKKEAGGAGCSGLSRLSVELGVN